jgi:hypothetical protein
MIFTLLLFGCLAEIPATWQNAYARSKAVGGFIVRRAVESPHFRFLRSTASLGLARWLYPIDLSQIMNNVTMMRLYLVRATSVLQNPAKWTNRPKNALSPKNAIHLSLFAGPAKLIRWISRFGTSQAYMSLQTRHPGQIKGLLFIGIVAVVIVRPGSAVDRLS